jgi:enamine deaminase RidA (YjgF/YER057c/UK114 family)
MTCATVLVLLPAFFALLSPAYPSSQKKKTQEKEEITQVLELPKEPPATVRADTSRLVFQVSPLSSKGLLSQQTRDALKALFRLNAKCTIVRLRAFVAGSGDTRRVQTIVSEMFTAKHAPLPVLTVVQSGALPLAGAQVIIESTAIAKKRVNPYGLAFLSGHLASSPDLNTHIAPLADNSVAGLAGVLHNIGVASQDVVRATCFLSSLEDIDAVQRRVRTEFPQAALNFVQTLRAPMQSFAACEAVARLKQPAGSPLLLVRGDTSEVAEFSRAALVSSPQVVLSGGQLAFHVEDTDARLAFARLNKELIGANAPPCQIAMLSAYPLSNSIGILVKRARAELCGAANPPAGTVLPFEGLPALDATFAVDVVAVPMDSH